LKRPTISIHAEYARLPRQLESPGSACSTCPATEIEYCYVRRNTSFKLSDNLTYKKEMDWREIRRERRSLSRAAESRSRIDAVPALDIDRRKSLNGPPDLREVQIGHVAAF
jgi:hypothetical protein